MSVLIAAAGDLRRARVRRELASALAPGTSFSEAGNVWEALQKAPGSGMVMLAGDLEDASASRLVHVLGQRHPRLPIVVMEDSGKEGSPRGSRED